MDKSRNDWYLIAVIGGIALSTLLLEIAIEQRASLTLGEVIALRAVPVSAGAWYGWLVRSRVLKLRSVGKALGERYAPKKVPTHRTATAEGILLFMLTGLAVFTAMVPPFFTPSENLRKLHGTVTQCGFDGKSSYSMTIHHEGRKVLIRVSRGHAELSRIAVGDVVTVAMDGIYAVELHRNGEAVFTYEQYKAREREFAQNMALAYAASVAAFLGWCVYGRVKNSKSTVVSCSAKSRHPE